MSMRRAMDFHTAPCMSTGTSIHRKSGWMPRGIFTHGLSTYDGMLPDDRPSRFFRNLIRRAVVIRCDRIAWPKRQSGVGPFAVNFLLRQQRHLDWRDDRP